jgi:hypothetical protein
VSNLHRLLRNVLRRPESKNIKRQGRARPILEPLEERLNPSNLVYVDDNWAGTANGADPANDPIGGLVFGTNAFSNIQSAVDAVSANGTVVVYGGTYSTDNPLNITKALVIEASVNPDITADATVNINEAVTLGANITFATTGVGSGAAPAALTFGSTIDDTTAGADSLTITGSQTVTFAGRVGYSVTPFAELTDQSATTVFNTDFFSTTGDQNYTAAVVVSDSVVNLSVQSGRSINFTSGASLTTRNSNVFMDANDGAFASGNFIGLTITGATITSTGGGNLDLRGSGGNDATSGGHDGVLIAGGGRVQASSHGQIRISGTGGAGTMANFGVAVRDSGTQIMTAINDLGIGGTGGKGTGTFNVGVIILSGAQVIDNDPNAMMVISGTGGQGARSDYGTIISGNGTEVTSAASLSVYGTGGGSGSGFNEIGVDVADGALVTATGSIEVAGDGGKGADADFGVVVADAGTVVQSATAVQFNGNGGGDGTGVGESGVLINTGAHVRAISGNASVTLVGRGNGPGGNGVELASGGTVRALGGPIWLLGNAPGDTPGISSTPSPGLIQTYVGTVTLMADVIDLATDSSNRPTVTATGGTGSLFFEPSTASRPIILGGSDVAGSLVYSDADNAAIAQGGSNGFSLVTVANPPSGTGSISTANNVTFGASATLQTFGGNIVVSNTLKTVGGTLTLNCNSKITTAGSGQLWAHNLALQANLGIGAATAPLQVAADTMTADTSAGQSDQFLSASGTVDVIAANGLNAGTGSVTLAGGTFLVDGSATAAGWTVKPGAILGGKGTIGGALTLAGYAQSWDSSRSGAEHCHA